MGNSESNPWIPLTQSFQEIEKIRFSYDLRKNPDDFNRYVSERIDRITKETLEKKRAAFQKAHTDMGRYFDMDHNAGFYKIRNRDLIYLQDQIYERSKAAASGLKHDKDLTRRQTEINEWYFQDKLETLFFLQMFFMVLLAMAIVMYLQKNEYITSPFAAYLTLILFGIVTATGLYRNQYTSQVRDGRFWHKRNFREKEIYVPTEIKPAKPCGCDEPGPGVPSEAEKCAQKAKAAAILATNASAAYAAETAKPYGQASLAMAQGVGAGAAQAGAGVAAGGAAVGAGAASAGTAAYVGARTIGSQILEDTKKTANRAGEAVDRANSQLEADTIAYITGDGRRKPQAGTGSSCPF
jgi:hypothetical protein